MPKLPDDLTVREDLAYGTQHEWIEERYGREVAERANYGWVVDEIDRVIATKVYGFGVLTTNIDTYQHTWEGFNHQ